MKSVNYPGTGIYYLHVYRDKATSVSSKELSCKQMVKSRSGKITYHVLLIISLKHAADKILQENEIFC